MAFSYPALRLNEAGVSVTDVANALGQSVSLTSMQLRGVRRPHPALYVVIRALTSPDVADAIATHLGEANSEVT